MAKARKFRITLPLVCLAAVVVLLVVLAPYWMESKDDAKLLAEGRAALETGDSMRATRFARAVLRDAPNDSAALLLAAEAAIEAGQRDDALQFLSHVREDHTQEAAEAFRLSAEMQLELGGFTAAEQLLHQSLQNDPSNEQARGRLAFLLAIQGRRWRAVPHFFYLAQHTQIEPLPLILLGHRGLDFFSPERLELAGRADPNNVGRLIGLARMAIEQNRLAEGRQLLEQAIAILPGAAEAHAQLSQLLLADLSAFAAWQAHIPAAADKHPDIWSARGMACLQRGQIAAALRCFLECARLDPDHRQAHYHLGRLVAELYDPEKAIPFQRRAQLLTRLEAVLHQLKADQENVALMQSAAGLCESLGRLWEARAWCNAALNFRPSLEWANAGLARLSAATAGTSQRVRPEDQPALSLDPALWPLPVWNADAAVPQPPDSQSPDSRETSIHFVEEAAARGIEFQFFNGADPATPGMRLLETNGGGAAAFDFDGDRWPDLYLVQGCEWPPAPTERRQDRLYRNVAGQSFTDVSAAAGLGDERFGQGVAAGDFDQDGFADLFVGNCGQSRLYRNQGDGTFGEVTSPAGLQADLWTTSCVLADLTADGLPDLYQATYVEGPDVHTRMCKFGGELPRACPPREFAAQADRLYVNQGDGTFADQSRAAGVDAAGGYGLGLLAADLSGDGRLELFVANDGTPNFYWTVAGGDSAPQFEDGAMRCGLACGADGMPRASMGVAADDADGDGRLDLFVTSFYREANTLFAQRQDGLFTDAAQQSGLAAPSYAMLGFGTQFLDADLDGDADLFIANGHVDDFRHMGRPFEMRPQLMRNQGQGTFAELTPSAAGDYFERELLGRAVVRLDWNGDGREDLVVTHLDQPIALLTNDSEAAGPYIAISLIGVASCRDAIGAKVTLRAGNYDRTRQLTAGDGYLASNQRQLIFALPPGATRAEADITWPSGQQQHVANLLASSHVLLVEGREEAAEF